MLTWLPAAAAVLTISIGMMVLSGWIFDWPTARLQFAGQVTMKANTAAGFVLCGLILLLSWRPVPTWLAGLRVLLESVVLLLGLLTLVQYVLGLDSALDELLVRAPPDELFTMMPGRMAPTTALAFVLFAGAIIASRWHTPVAKAVKLVGAICILLISLVSLLGYAYGVPTLYLGVSGVTAMALVTASLFAALGCGLICLSPHEGFPALLVERTITGAHVRALLPIVLITPLAVGAAVVMGYGTYYEGHLAVALTSLGSVLAAALVSIVSVAVLRRAEGALVLRDRALAATSSGVLITDHRQHDEPIVFANKAFTDITGFSEADILGRNCRFLNAGIECNEPAREMLRQSIASGRACTVELKNHVKGGGFFWNRLSLSPVENRKGQITHFVGIIDDVSDSRQQQEQVHNALAEAKSANELRDTFIRLVSHELRTPMNAALTWMGLMEVDNSEETRNQGLEIIANSIQTQARLIDDLVDVTRLSTAGVRLEPGLADVREVVAMAVEELRPSIAAQHQLTLELEEGDYQMVVDAVRLQQVVRNLVNNALKYTPAGGRIDINLKADRTQVCLQVSDSGKGLTAEQVERLFEPFWRADNKVPGIGIGLFIVAGLVDAHGGQVEVESAGLGQGTTFSVYLPRNTEMPQYAAMEETRTRSREKS